MKVVLYGKAFGKDYDCLMRDMLHLLQESGVEIIVYESFLSDIKHCFDDEVNYAVLKKTDDIKGKADVLFSFGGDGTILQASAYASEHDKLLLGINTGRLGFMASMETDELENLSRLKAMWYMPSVKLTIHPPFSPLKA